MYVPVHSLRGLTCTHEHHWGSAKPAHKDGSSLLASARPPSEGYIRMGDAGIPALLQLEVKVGLLSQRGDKSVWVCACQRGPCEDEGEKRLLEAVGWAEANGATAGHEILFTYS